jgi:hypothetical protein
VRLAAMERRDDKTELRLREVAATVFSCPLGDARTFFALEPISWGG